MTQVLLWVAYTAVALIVVVIVPYLVAFMLSAGWHDARKTRI